MDPREGCDVYNIKMGILCQWRNETQLATNLMKPNCPTKLSIRFLNLSWQNCLMANELPGEKARGKDVKSKDAYGQSPENPPLPAHTTL